MNQAVDFEYSTPRLRLRPLAIADESLYVSLYTDPESMRFIGPPLSPERAARSFRWMLRLNEARPPTNLVFALIHQGTAEAVGICSLQQIDRANRRAEGGIMIRADSRSHGFATEGLTGLVKGAFTELGLDEVRVRIACDHAIVERLVVRVGFRRIDPAPGENPELSTWWASRAWF